MELAAAAVVPRLPAPCSLRGLISSHHVSPPRTRTHSHISPLLAAKSSQPQSHPLSVQQPNSSQGKAERMDLSSFPLTLPSPASPVPLTVLVRLLSQILRLWPSRCLAVGPDEAS